MEGIAGAPEEVTVIVADSLRELDPKSVVGLMRILFKRYGDPTTPTAVKTECYNTIRRLLQRKELPL